MPIDATDIAQAGQDIVPPDAAQGTRNHGLRLALTPAAVFCAGLILGWPLFYVGAVFATLFTQTPHPLTTRAGARLLVNATAIMGVAWLLATWLNPYPVVFLLGICIALGLAFRCSVSGGSTILVVLLLLGTLLVPFLVRTSSVLAWDIALSLVANIAIALASSWVAFAVFPAADATRTAPPAPAPVTRFDPNRRLARMCLVSIPFAIVFFVSGSGAALTLIFVAILATQLAASTEAGPTVARTMLAANVLGGIVAVIIYEAIVIAPLLPFAILAVLATCLALADRFTRGDALAGSALTTVLILLGGSLGVFSEEADVKMLGRIWQIGLALVYILSAFVLIDRWLPERARD